MLFDSLSVLLQLAIYISVPILLTPEVSIYTLSLLAVISIPFFIVSKKAKLFGDSATRAANFCARSVFDIIQHAQVIKSHNCEKRELDTYEKHLNKHIKDVQSFTLLARSVPVSTTFVTRCGKHSSLSKFRDIWFCGFWCSNIMVCCEYAQF